MYLHRISFKLNNIHLICARWTKWWIRILLSPIVHEIFWSCHIGSALISATSYMLTVVSNKCNKNVHILNQVDLLLWRNSNEIIAPWLIAKRASHKGSECQFRIWSNLNRNFIICLNVRSAIFFSLFLFLSSFFFVMRKRRCSIWMRL